MKVIKIVVKVSTNNNRLLETVEKIVEKRQLIQKGAFLNFRCKMEPELVSIIKFQNWDRLNESRIQE